VNSAEGFNDRVRRTVAGVFHHISQKHSERYLDEVAFRWNQRICTGTAIRTNRKGKPKARAQYDRLSPVTQMRSLFAHAFGRQMRRTPEGSLVIV
jgi:hypothetical protein